MADPFWCGSDPHGASRYHAQYSGLRVPPFDSFTGTVEEQLRQAKQWQQQQQAQQREHEQSQEQQREQQQEEQQEEQQPPQQPPQQQSQRQSTPRGRGSRRDWAPRHHLSPLPPLRPLLRRPPPPFNLWPADASSSPPSAPPSNAQPTVPNQADASPQPHNPYQQSPTPRGAVNYGSGAPPPPGPYQFNHAQSNAFNPQYRLPAPVAGSSAPVSPLPVRPRIAHGDTRAGPRADPPRPVPTAAPVVASPSKDGVVDDGGYDGDDDDDWLAFEAEVIKKAPTTASAAAVAPNYVPLPTRPTTSQLALRRPSAARSPIEIPAIDTNSIKGPLVGPPPSKSVSPGPAPLQLALGTPFASRAHAPADEDQETKASPTEPQSANTRPIPKLSLALDTATAAGSPSFTSAAAGPPSATLITSEIISSATSVTDLTQGPPFVASLAIKVESDEMQREKGKRKASEDPQSPVAAKRIKKDDSAQPEEPKQPKVPAIPFPEKAAVIEERNGEIEFRVVNNDNERESLIILTGLKCIFQKQLPKMPKDYIARLVYDRTHLSIAIVKKPLEVVGGITFRPFRDRKFAEIVFCAISSDQQVKGYGAHLMAHLKDYVKATSPVMHFLTYADNYAIGYFKKQGFTKEITLDKSVWMGYIKDYEGGTIMQCTMLPRVRYLESGRMLLKQREAVMAKIRAFSKSHVVHQPPKQWKNGITSIDPMKIEAIKNSGWSPEMDELARQPRRGANYNQLLHLLNAMQNHQSAWPFLVPVNRDEVQDYYEVIKEPMDLSTMEQKLEMDQYPTPEDFLKDAMLIFKNCRQYNSEGTPYTKMANKLEKFMWSKIREIPEWSHYEEEYATKK